MKIIKKKFLEELSEYKNYWNAVHVAADKFSEKFIAGKVQHVFIQGTTGSVIVDVANEVSWDQQLVGIGEHYRRSYFSKWAWNYSSLV